MKKYNPIKLTNATIIIIGIGIVSAYIYKLVVTIGKESFEGYPFVDALFIIGSIVFLISGVEFVYEQGLFNAPRYFFRKVVKKKGTETDDPIDTMSLVEYISHRPKGFFLTLPGLLSGILMIASAFIISIIFLV